MRKPGSFFLFTLASLMSRASQQFSVLMFAHFLSAFFYDTSQKITPHHKKYTYVKFEPVFYNYSVTILHSTLISIMSIIFSRPF
jgi:hypothetical protein